MDGHGDDQLADRTETLRVGGHGHHDVGDSNGAGRDERPTEDPQQHLHDFSTSYRATARMTIHSPPMPNTAWNAYGSTISGARNDALRRSPSAATYPIQTSEISSATAAPIHHNIELTLLPARLHARRAFS